MLALMKHWAMALLTPRPFVGLLYVPRYIKQFAAYKRLEQDGRLRIADSYPCLTDAVVHTPFDPHYFYQGAWIARRLVDNRPEIHVDVGSSVMSMSVLSATVPMVFVDYRPVQVSLDRFLPVAGSITQLPFLSGSLASISSLHVLEHIGLGRYGDPLDAAGSKSGAGELERVTRGGGRIFVTVPIGRERVCFNAHRVFSVSTVVSWFQHCRLIEISFVDDTGQFHENIHERNTPKLEYGCGMFIFEKLP